MLLSFIRNDLIVPLNDFKPVVDFNTLRVHFLLITLQNIEHSFVLLQPILIDSLDIIWLGVLSQCLEELILHAVGLLDGSYLGYMLPQSLRFTFGLHQVVVYLFNHIDMLFLFLL